MLKEDEIWFSKAKSQNFLVDKNYVMKISEALKFYNNNDFIEIGGGSGNISIILAHLSKNLTIIELDNYFSSILSYIFTKENNSNYSFSEFLSDFKNEMIKYLDENSKKVKVQNENYLNFHFDFTINKKPIIFGNIPYNISTPILTKLSKEKKIFEAVFLTTQKEYFERLVGKTEKSFLTLFADYHFDILKLFDIPSTAFFPQPKVNSTFFKLTPKNSYFDLKMENDFFSFVSKSFSNKRKKLLNNFKEDKILYEKLIKIFSDEKIDFNIRAEEFNLNDFMKIFSRLLD